jgi:polyphosphate kinase 2 (PPK2 family)
MNLEPPETWRKHYEQINAFEKHLTENGYVLLKFFLHISKREQRERLEARLDDPRKNWKFEPNDLKMRALWPQFTRAYEEVLNRCSTPFAPWRVIPANRKWYRDYIVAKTVVKTMEGMKLRWPKPTFDPRKIKIDT